MKNFLDSFSHGQYPFFHGKSVLILLAADEARMKDVKQEYRETL